MGPLRKKRGLVYLSAILLTSLPFFYNACQGRFQTQQQLSLGSQCVLINKKTSSPLPPEKNKPSVFSHKKLQIDHLITKEVSQKLLSEIQVATLINVECAEQQKNNNYISVHSIQGKNIKKLKR